MNEILEKLDRLRNVTQWHDSMYPLFDLWRKQIEEAEEDMSFLQLKPIIKLAENIKRRVTIINEDLRNNRDLTAEQRQNLFAMRDVFEVELATFSREHVESTVRDISTQIDHEMEPFDSHKNEGV